MPVVQPSLHSAINALHERRQLAKLQGKAVVHASENTQQSQAVCSADSTTLAAILEGAEWYWYNQERTRIPIAKTKEAGPEDAAARATLEQPDFLTAPAFAGAKAGYAFTTGSQGLGYYRCAAALCTSMIEVTCVEAP